MDKLGDQVNARRHCPIEICIVSFDQKTRQPAQRNLHVFQILFLHMVAILQQHQPVLYFFVLLECYRRPLYRFSVAIVRAGNLRTYIVFVSPWWCWWTKGGWNTKHNFKRLQSLWYYFFDPGWPSNASRQDVYLQISMTST